MKNNWGCDKTGAYRNKGGGINDQEQLNWISSKTGTYVAFHTYYYYATLMTTIHSTYPNERYHKRVNRGITTYKTSAANGAVFVQVRALRHRTELGKLIRGLAMRCAESSWNTHL